MLKRIGAEEGGEFKAVASGTLPCGRPVIVNADGTVSVVSSSSETEAIGSEATFEAGNSWAYGIGFDSSNNKIVIAFRDQDDSGNGKAIIGTVSDTSISFGSPVTFNSGNTDMCRVVYDSGNNKIVIVYRDSANSSQGTAVVGTVSGTSISFGSDTIFETGNTQALSATFDSSSGKIVAAFKDFSDSNKGKAIVGTVSGTSISFGSAALFKNSAIGDDTAITFDSSNNKIVVFYTNSTNSDYGTAKVGTVSGTSIDFSGSSDVVFESSSSAYFGATFDSSNNKVVVAYKDSGATDGRCAVGTVSGTSISFGTPVIFETGTTSDVSAVFDSNANKVVLAFSDTGADITRIVVGTVSGTTISFGSPVNANTGSDDTYIASAFDSTNNRVVVVFRDLGDSNKGKAIVFRNASTTNNLTSENYIGMSRGVVAGEPASTGTAVSFESGSTQLPKAVFDTNSNRIVIAYLDGGNSDKGTAVVGTVSGTSISFGTPVIYEQGGTANIAAVFDSSNNKVVVIYQDNGDSGRGKGIVGTVDPSDNSISFGTATQFNSGANNAYNIGAAFDSSNNKVVVAYRDNGNSDYGTAAVGTVSGTSISFGTPVVFNSVNSTSGATVVFDSSNNKVVLAFQDSGSNGYAYVGTVSGTSISFGSKATFNSGDTTQIAATFDSSNNKVVLAYRANANSNQGTAIVGTISGTSISFGSGVIFNTGNTQGTSAVFDTNVNKVLISYEDRGDSDLGKFIVGTVSGTSISFDTETTFSGSNAVFHTGAAFESNANKVVIAYANDTDSSDRGEAIVTNIDSITRGEVADGGNASVDIIGSVSTNQSSLTAGQQYFVQNDGTISTTADSPSVLAGTAISATELVVKT